MKFLFVYIGGWIVFGYRSAHAATFEPIPTTFTTGLELLNLIEVGGNWFFALVMLSAVVFIILAGIQLITDGGNPSTVTSARKKLIFAISGIAIAVLSRGIVAAVKAIFGG